MTADRTQEYQQRLRFKELQDAAAGREVLKSILIDLGCMTEADDKRRLIERIADRLFMDGFVLRRRDP